MRYFSLCLAGGLAAMAYAQVSFPEDCSTAGNKQAVIACRKAAKRQDRKDAQEREKKKNDDKRRKKQCQRGKGSNCDDFADDEDDNNNDQPTEEESEQETEPVTEDNGDSNTGGQPANESNECVNGSNLNEIFISLANSQYFDDYADEKLNFINLPWHAHGDLWTVDRGITEPNFVLHGEEHGGVLYYRISGKGNGQPEDQFLGWKEFDDDGNEAHNKPVVFEEDPEGDNLWKIVRKAGTDYYRFEYKSLPGMCLSRSPWAVYFYLIECESLNWAGKPADALMSFTIGNADSDQVVSDCFQ